MIQFWDIIYFEQISLIYNSPELKHFEEEEQAEIKYEYIEASNRSVWNKKFRERFTVIYFLTMTLILLTNLYFFEFEFKDKFG